MGSYSRERYATESASFPKSANSAPASYSYATFADLPTSGSTPGNTAFVVATNRLYIWSGVGWYLIATVTNASPTAITGVSDTYTLATNGTATTVTAVSTDPEGFALSWSYSVSSGALNGTTVSQADNVFTITPHASNPTTFSITFNVTDGLNGSVSKVSAFTLAFTVTNSRYTALSVKATATGSNQTFDDASASNHTITVAGNSITSTFSPYRHGGYSAYFTTSGSTSGSGGTGQYIQSDLTSELTLDTNDFTISCWVYGISKLRNYPRILQIGPQNTPWGASQLSILYKHDSDNDSITLAMQGIGVNSLLIASGPINDNQWYHVALTRSGSTFTLYIDGVSVGTYTSTGSATGAGNKAILIGSASSGDSDFHGYISDVRVINGTSIYTGNFTPPTEPSTVVTNTKFLLSNLPYFKDKSASNHAITATGNASLRPKSLFDNGAYSEASHGASAYFDGTGDYLTGPSSATIGIGTGDFTIECWFYATDGTSIDRGIWETRTDGYPNWSEGLSLTRLTETTFRLYGSSALIVSSATTITNNWNHLAVVRNSGTLEFFVNGVSQGTVSNSTNMNSAQPIAIGSGRYTNSNSTPTHAVKGYIQDFRVLTSALYTSNFTPPTAPLTAITNTAFLSNMNNGQIVDGTKNAHISLQGNTKVTHSEKKFGTGSLLIEGNGDGALVHFDQPEHIKFGESDFTMELHVRFITVGPTRLLSNWSTSISGQTDEWSLGMLNSTTIQFQYSGGPTYFTWAPSADTWYHIAVTKESTNLRIFIDGVQIGTTVTLGNVGSTDPDATSTSLNKIMNIGGSTAGSSESTNMYIDNVRISDFARYTSGFTPPATEHGTQG